MLRDTHLNFLRLLFTLVGKDDLSFYYKQQSTANSNSFKCAEKTACEAKGRLYTTGKVIQRLFIIDLYT